MGTPVNEPRSGAGLHAGDLVRIRSQDEILATLDASARLEGLPFMPEMLRHCGETVRVFRRADKTCDNNWSPGMRRMERAAFLWGLRCDGSAHGGCQAGCSFFWKEDWLALVPEGGGPGAALTQAGWRDDANATAPQCTLADLMRATTVGAGPAGETYSCQATEVKRATTPLFALDLRQYVRDVRSGNVGIGRLAVGLPRQLVAQLRELLARRPMRTARDSIGGSAASALDLQPGDRVQVRSKSEIEATLDPANRNRGLAFNEEMLGYCGGEYRVLRRVEKIINEPSGRMVRLRDCVILDGVTCLGDYHLFCARGVYPYWREVWLRRLD